MNKPLKRWLISCLILIVLIAAFDVLMDPYLQFDTPRIKGLNARKPAAGPHEQWMKAVVVQRERPATVILGSSPTDIGIDPSDAAWPAHNRPVYNLSLPNSNLYTQRLYLQRAMGQARISTVVLGIDVNVFITGFFADHPESPEDEQPLAANPDGANERTQRWRHLQDISHTMLTLNALSDSTSTLFANLSGDSLDLLPGGKLHITEIFADGPDPLRPLLFILDDLGGLRLRKDRVSSQYVMAMTDLEDLLNLCESHGSQVIIVIDPVHADMLELLDQQGYWPTLEVWKRDLVRMADRHPDGKVTLWDFADYDIYSTEHVIPQTDSTHWYFDSVHFKRALGHLVLQRIFNPAILAPGRQLNKENIDEQLTLVRQRQRQFRKDDPLDAGRARDLYLIETAVDAMNASRYVPPKR